MIINEVKIPGNFNNNPIEMMVFEAEDSQKIILNIHCLYGSLRGSGDKQVRMAEKLANQNLASVVLYGSSRNSGFWMLPKGMQKMMEFRWKTFSDELADAKSILWEVEKKFGKNIDIIIVGHSLGGMLAFYLAEEFANISAIITVGMGLRSERVNKPILSTFPSEEEIVQKLEKFSGKYLMCSDSEDEIFSEEKFQKFYEKVGTKEKVREHFIGVEHNFNKLFGERSDKPFDAVISSIEKMLKNEKILSGEKKFKK